MTAHATQYCLNCTHTKDDHFGHWKQKGPCKLCVCPLYEKKVR